MKKNFVSNSKKSERMFKSSIFEALSKVHFTIPLIIFIPIISYFIYLAFFVEENSFLKFSTAFIAGILVWTLTEYILHRYIFHYQPKSKIGLRLHFIFHGVHHDYPNDALRLVMPPTVSIPLAALFYFIFNSFIPKEYLPAFFAAFLLGYLFYDISHYAIHHFNVKNKIWKKMKQHHMMHHYSDPNLGYGVSSSLWDKIFKSDFKK